MELDGAKVLVAGAGGALGAGLTRALLDAGAVVVPGGRDGVRLAELGTGQEPVTYDAVDTESVRRAVDAAASSLGGLDALVCTVGVPGFGPAISTDPAVTEELFAVNVLGPMALVRAAAPHLSEGGLVVVLSAILADLPTAGMADYSAAKSALSTWLGVLRREERRRFGVLDVRPPHLDTGLDTRALAGDPPPLPEPYAATEVVTAVVQGMRDGVRELVWDQKAGALTPK